MLSSSKTIKIKYFTRVLGERKKIVKLRPLNDTCTKMKTWCYRKKMIVNNIYLLKNNPSCK